jgi:hypothetical protein
LTIGVDMALVEAATSDYANGVLWQLAAPEGAAPGASKAWGRVAEAATA